MTEYTDVSFPTTPIPETPPTPVQLDDDVDKSTAGPVGNIWNDVFKYSGGNSSNVRIKKKKPMSKRLSCKKKK